MTEEREKRREKREKKIIEDVCIKYQIQKCWRENAEYAPQS